MEYTKRKYNNLLKTLTGLVNLHDTCGDSGECCGDEWHTMEESLQLKRARKIIAKSKVKE
jgi:hypothetical protein